MKSIKKKIQDFNTRPLTIIMLLIMAFIYSETHGQSGAITTDEDFIVLDNDHTFGSKFRMGVLLNTNGKWQYGLGGWDVTNRNRYGGILISAHIGNHGGAMQDQIELEAGRIYMNTNVLEFVDNWGQKMNLSGNDYGIGIQDKTQYFRTGGNFAWYKGGSHVDDELSPDPDNDSTKVLMVLKEGNLGIGTKNPGTYKLAVEGSLGARSIDVHAHSWSDFVFEHDYPLRSLKAVSAYIQSNGHLPDVPSESEIREAGINVSKMFKLQMQKIEELTLYVIELEEKISSLNSSGK